ncbi:MAG: DUF2924 domain-containing protein [Mesorhizobium sp.]|nr:DUF2924 domain-containing protein [Mesorhizobium sp.]
MRGKLDIAAEVAALSDLSRDELVELWRKVYGVAPPKGIRQELMVRAVAWHLQAKRLGGLSGETRRLLRSAKNRVESEMLARDRPPDTRVDEPRKLGEGADGVGQQIGSVGVASVSRQRRRLTPGARLVREWNGHTHTIDVIEGGYVFEAKVYPSLTVIAGKITGTHWSGPRFFGL